MLPMRMPEKTSWPTVVMTRTVGWAKSPAVALVGGHGARAILPTRKEHSARLCPPYKPFTDIAIPETLALVPARQRHRDRLVRGQRPREHLVVAILLPLPDTDRGAQVLAGVLGVLRP